MDDAEGFMSKWMSRSNAALATATAVSLLAPAAASAAPQTTHHAIPQGLMMSYQVRPGDTVWGISQRTGIPIPDIIRVNNLGPTALIRIGQRLQLPAQTPVVRDTPQTNTPAPVPAPAPAPEAAPSQYVVQAGDTLSAIAARFNTTVSAIADSNGISNPNLLFPGQVLNLSGAATDPTPAPAKERLVENNFPGYTYPDDVVDAANNNKHSLITKELPSRAEVQRMVRETAVQMGVDPRLALAHAYIESGFDASAVSPANAIGIMQVIPSSGEWAGTLVGRSLDLLNPQDNIVAGIAIIRYLHNAADNFDDAVAGYYQGLGGVQMYGMRPDTVAYVAKIKAAMNRF